MKLLLLPILFALLHSNTTSLTKHLCRASSHLFFARIQGHRLSIRETTLLNRVKKAGIWAGHPRASSSCCETVLLLPILFASLFLDINNITFSLQVVMGGASESLQKYAALLGASGVALGALGSHALKDTLAKGNHSESWKTGILYQLLHATALIGVSALARDTNAENEPDLLRAGQCMALGSLLFSGSIYGLCLNIGPKRLLGPTTPLGGLFMIGGWVLLGFGTSRKSKN